MTDQYDDEYDDEPNRLEPDEMPDLDEEAELEWPSEDY